METTEKIVESYVRYVQNWATIANIRCPEQKEIDLLAVDPLTLKRYHIESGVSISQGFSKLTAKPFSIDLFKQRLKKPGQRMTIGYFHENKFSHPKVLETLRLYGFKPGNYERIVVAWGYNDDVPKEAEKLGITLWKFPDLMVKIASLFEGKRTYFIDDTLRTMHLYQMTLLNK